MDDQHKKPPPPPEGALPQRENRRKRRSAAAAEAEAIPRASSERMREASPAATQEAAGSSALPDWSSMDAAVQYEYLEHTADIRVHSWGASVAEAFEQQVVAIMGLITELPSVRVDGPSGRHV